MHVRAQQRERQRRRLGPADGRAEAQATGRGQPLLQQVVMLHVLRPGLERAAAQAGQAVRVAQAQVQRQAVQAAFDVLRGQRAQLGHDARVALDQARRKTCGDGQGRGHGADPQPAAGLAAAAGQFLREQFLLVQHAVGRGQHALALGRQALVLATPAHDGRAQLRFQRAQRIGQRGLGDVAGGSRTAEVAVLLQCGQVAVGVEQVHGRD